MTLPSPVTIGHATLYTFSTLMGGRIKVVRLTSTVPDDWHTWPEQYLQDYPHPNIGELLEISAVEIVDDRNL